MLNNLLSPDLIATLYVPIIISLASLFLINKFSKASLFFTLAILCSIIFSVQYLDSSFFKTIQYQDYISVYFLAIICSFTYFANYRATGLPRLFMFLLFSSLLIPMLILSASAKLAMFVASICTVLGCYWAYSLVLKKNLELNIIPFILISFLVATAILQAKNYADMGDEVLWLLIAAPISLCIGTSSQYQSKKYFYYKVISIFCFQLLALGISALSYFDR